MREADIAIRLSPPAKNDLVQRRIMSVQCYAYAAPEYLKRHGTPCHAEDLDRHRLVVLGGDERRLGIDDTWLLKLGVAGNGTRRPIATLDNMGGLYQAVKSGLGIGALPHFIEPEAAGLVRVLTDAAAPPREGYLVYPSELRGSKRVIVFRDFLLAVLAEAGLQRAPVERRVRPLCIDGPPALPVRAEAEGAHEVAYA